MAERHMPPVHDEMQADGEQAEAAMSISSTLIY